MRFIGLGVVAVCLSASLIAQAPGSTPAAGPKPSPTGTLNEIMRGIYFPSANLIFDVQLNDPATAARPTGVEGSAAAFSGVYPRWAVVEYAAVALADATDLLLTPGRLCQNGKPAPVSDPEYRKYAENMRKVGLATLEIVRTKDREKVSDATSDLVDACQNCHQVYRRGDETKPTRCVAPAR